MHGSPPPSASIWKDRHNGVVRRIAWPVLRSLFQLVLCLPGPVLLRIAGLPALRGQPDDLEPRVQFHAWMVRRFRKPGGSDPVELRKPALLSLSLLEGSAEQMASLADWTISGPGGPLSLRIYRPKTVRDDAPVLLYFHFGGCVLGDLETCHTACSLLAHHGECIVVSVAYRLAPEHRFPAAVEDAVAAFLWARANARSFGGDPARIGVGGDSAGGYLAAAVSLVMRKRSMAFPYLQLLIYPVIDMARTTMPTTRYDFNYPLTRDDMIWFAEHYLRSPEDVGDPLCSIGRASTLVGFPQTIFIQAGHDVLRDEGVDFARRLEDDGVPLTLRCYERLPHAFTAMSGGVPAARTAITEIATLVRQAFHAPGFTNHSGKGDVK